jgi:D-methionine transport system ATP-binding protein
LDYSSSELVNPVVSNMVKKFDVTTNIFYGNVELLQGQTIGSLVLIIKGITDERQYAKTYLQEQGVKFEILDEKSNALKKTDKEEVEV